MRGHTIPVLLLATLLFGGCAAPAEQPEVALAAPAAAARPVDGVELAPGATHRFPDVLPGVLDADIALADPQVFPYSAPLYTYLSGAVDGSIDLVTLLSADDVVLLADPFVLPPPDGERDIDDSVFLPPGEVLPRLAALPFLEVIAPQRPLAVAGMAGTAVDVRVPDLPATATCIPGGPLCAGLLAVPGNLQYVVSGQELRFVELVLPVGRVLVVQNLLDPRSQSILDGTTFVERPLPAQLGQAQVLSYARGPLVPDTEFGVALPDAGVGITFRTGAVPTVGYAPGGVNVSVISPDLPSDLEQGAFGYQASTETLYGYVAPTADLLIPDAGVDPRTIGPTAFEQSTGSATGLVDVVAAQAWAEVLAAPADTMVGGLPGRSVDVRLRSGAGTVPCTLSAPAVGSCAVLVYSRALPSIWLLSDRVLRVSEVNVGDAALTVITGVDEGGRAFADGLRLVELP